LHPRVRPESPTVNVEAWVEPLTGSLPAIVWRWDPETDILSGAFKGNRKSGGLTGTVELTDDEGSVAVLDISNGENPNAKIVLANPRIVIQLGASKAVEGCLSIPGWSAHALRPKFVKVLAQNIKGDMREIRAFDLLARALCHEIDHLDGILFLKHVIAGSGAYAQ